MTAAAAVRKEVAVLSPRIRTGIVVLVAALWAASTVTDMVNPNYQPDPALNGLFGLVVGAALAAGKKDEDDDTTRRRR